MLRRLELTVWLGRAEHQFRAPNNLPDRSLMVANSDGAKKIWGTEAGALRLWSSWSSFTGPLFIYELRDAGTNRANREDNWGQLTTNGTPKPAWHAFTAALGR